MAEDRTIPEPDVSEENPLSEHWVWRGKHRAPSPRALVERFIENWGEQHLYSEVHPSTPFTKTRREILAAKFPAKTLVIPTGNLKVRANDTDYRFRPSSDFFYLTSCHEPDCVLVISPDKGATLYISPRRDSSTHDFFSDSRYGELWVGPRHGVDEAAVHYEIQTAPLDSLESDLKGLKASDVLTVRGFDESVDDLLKENENDVELHQTLHEMRLTKDAFEIEQLQVAIDFTVKGFEDVVRALPEAEGRGERVIEGIFNLRARTEGNDVGYDTIAASGSNATILHWTRNNGKVNKGEMLLLDAGVECSNLYTADVTRTMPINGKFSPAQRRIYDVVYAAQEAGIAAVKPGAAYRAPHDAAMRVLAEGLFDLGILKEEPEHALQKHLQLHARWTLHSVSHHLGLDVHDCAQARNEQFIGPLFEGYVITVEPGLYFQKNDLLVPEEYRGIGVRIEDDILVTATGFKNLSSGLPRQADEVETWMQEVWRRGTTNLQL